MTYPLITVSGPPREAGLALGRAAAARIRKALDDNLALHETLIPFAAAAEGAAWVSGMEAAQRAAYPDLVAELEGMAEGAEAAFSQLFLLSVRSEAAAALEPKGCFEAALISPSVAVLGHNEDADAGFAETAFLARHRAEGWLAFCYPGFPPGMTFGFNWKSGLVFTCDSVSPRPMRIGRARHFIARDLMRARSFEDALSRALPEGRASGNHFLVADVAARRAVSIEAGVETADIAELRGAFLHANHYLRLKTGQHLFASSPPRQERAESLPPAQDIAGLRAILSDDAGAYPIWRRAVPPDSGVTLCTALFDLDAGRLEVFRGKPDSAPPAHLFDLAAGQTPDA
jgi:hypothetical protein